MSIWKKRLLCFALFVIITGTENIPGQNSTYHPVFDDTYLPRIDILIHPDSLAMILDPNRSQSDHEFPATFIFQSPGIQDTVEQAGFRLRGNTSRNSLKKSFKISINTFFKGRKFFGLEKLNLNGEHNDPSIIRAKLSWDIFRDFGIPASRANHVQLFINHQYYGLYINVEHIDENFVKSRFGNNDGNLYKCLWPADLTYRSSNPDDYKFAPGDRRTYDLKTNEEIDDYSDLAEFIAIINKTSDDQFVAKIQEIFNVNDFLKILAVDVATASWDDYWFLKNNYYLYHNSQTGKFEYIPYDYDNTFGIWWDGISPGIDWGNRDIYSWGHPTEPRPLVKRILGFPIFRDRFSYYVHQLLQEIYSLARMEPRIDAIHQLIWEAAEADTFRTLDYGYSINDFHTSYDQALGGHVTYGLKPFITYRRNTALTQLNRMDIFPVIRNVSLQPDAPNTASPISVTVRIEDEDPQPQVYVHYSLNGSEFSAVKMHDDGQHMDGVAGDKIFGGLIPPLQAAGQLRFFIQASDNNNHVINEPYSAPEITYEIPVSATPPRLFINEFLASNNQTLADAYGEYDDWVEIYNGEDSDIWLGDKYLTDDFDNPNRWQFPDIALPAGGFLLIWTDGSPEQGPLHTPFRLDKEGEEIGLFDASLSVIDSVTFSLQQTDTSMGRNPDGGDSWQFFPQPSPGLSNQITGIDGQENNLPEWQLGNNYPNPFNGETVIPVYLPWQAPVRIEVYNPLGQKIRTLAEQTFPAGEHRVHWDGKYGTGNAVPSGIYFVRMQIINVNSAVWQSDKKLLLIR